MCESNFKKNLLPGIALFEYCTVIVDTILFSNNKTKRERERMMVMMLLDLLIILKK